jgi:hypothetical protein
MLRSSIFYAVVVTACVAVLILDLFYWRAG